MTFFITINSMIVIFKFFKATIILLYFLPLSFYSFWLYCQILVYQISFINMPQYGGGARHKTEIWVFHNKNWYPPPGWMSSVSHQIIIIRELKHLYLITVINSRPNLIVMIMGKIKFYHINFFILFLNLKWEIYLAIIYSKNHILLFK